MPFFVSSSFAASAPLLLALVAAGCADDGGAAGWGTGGDDQMPDDPNPGPNGPACGKRMGRPPGPGDLEGFHPAEVERVVTFRGESGFAESRTRGGSGHGPTSVAAPRRPVGASTGGPHVHERWGESRKLELSYCINVMPGDNAENEEIYFKTIRSLNATTAEWERVTGANFVHVREDDTPAEDPHVTIIRTDFGEDRIARADCAAGTNAYFGVIASDIYEQGISNAVPQKWNDPALEPLDGNLTRTVLLASNIVASFGDVTLRTVLRHELGHMMGFAHEEINYPGSMGNSCTDDDPRPVTPVEPTSVMSTPGCTGFSDKAQHLTHHDRLSAFFLQHTPRSRFETRGAVPGYRYGGELGGGAEILWHTEGSTEGVLWRPQLGPASSITFEEQAFLYSSPAPPPPEGWFPSHAEVVIPLQLTGGPATFDVLLYGPGSGVDDLAVFNSGLTTTAAVWAESAFAVPVVGRFDGEDLERDIVYMYRPGTEGSTAVVGSSGDVTVVADVPQYRGYAYPLAAPYRGANFPDDIVWFEPKEGRFMTWRLGGSGILQLAGVHRASQNQLGLAHGENIPAIGDFNGDGRADIMWHGVSNLYARLPDITDVLWLSNSTATEVGFDLVPKDIGQTFRPFVGDFDGDGIHDIFWHRSWGMTSEGPAVGATGPSFVWYFDAAGGHVAEAFVLDGDYSPYVGDFDADGCHDVAWLDTVEDTLHLWRCLPGERDFDCGVATHTPPDAAPVGMHWGF